MQSIREVECGEFGVMLLTETKIQTESYSHNQLGYNVDFLLACPSRYRGVKGSVVLVTRERLDWWGIKFMRFHRPYVVRCKIVTGHI